MIKKDFDKALEIITLAGQIVLGSGGETYRAENICVDIANKLGIKKIDVLALPTGLLITIEKGKENHKTMVRRMRVRVVNLEKLALVHRISQEITPTNIDKSLALLKSLNKLTPKHRYYLPFFAGLAAGFFCVMLGGHFGDFLVAFLCGLFIQLVAVSFKRIDVFSCLISMFGGFFAAAFSLFMATVIPGINYELAIIGSMIPLMPGLAFTNSIRDTMHGDLLSGTSRMAEALMVAASLAFGVGIVLSLKGLVGL